MKEQMIGYLQKLVDGYRESVRDKNLATADFIMGEFKACKKMFETVVGKEVTVEHWKVVAKGENK